MVESCVRFEYVHTALTAQINPLIQSNGSELAIVLALMDSEVETILIGKFPATSFISELATVLVLMGSEVYNICVCARACARVCVCE